MIQDQQVDVLQLIQRYKNNIANTDLTSPVQDRIIRLVNAVPTLTHPVTNGNGHHGDASSSPPTSPVDRFLTLLGAMGELSDVFQFLGDAPQTMTVPRYDQARRALMRVVTAWVALARACHLDLQQPPLRQSPQQPQQRSPSS